jgi:uncharacterized SAM-binding protein YcdF (DUF218 family)
VDGFFYFKRIVGMAAQPLPLVFFLLAAGAALTAFTARKRCAYACFALAVAVLFVCAFPPAARLLARPLESLYPPYAGEADFSAIVVPGKGVMHTADSRLPALSRLGDGGRARVAEAVRLWRLRPEAMFVTCGYASGGETGADAMAAAAVELGVDPDKIIRLGEGLDTRHEAELSAPVVGGGKTLVVTAAAHMPRAIAYFRAAGVNASAAPCDFIAPVDEAVYGAATGRDFLPNASRIAHQEALWHEYIGILYLWLSGGGNALEADGDGVSGQ